MKQSIQTSAVAVLVTGYLASAMKIFVVLLTVLLDLIHAADGATNDTTAVKPSRPPLIVAVERGDRGAVEKLLRDGADVEVRTPDGVTPLYLNIAHK